MNARSSTLMAIAICMLPAVSAGQSMQDQSVCADLIGSGRAGLHIAYPAPLGGPPTVLPVRSDIALEYNPDARFYFVPRSSSGFVRVGHEGVWHVRTMTKAKSTIKANQTIAWRAPTRTACSGSDLLPYFDDNDRFVSLRRYFDHHAPSGERRPTDPELASKFHFSMGVPPNGCFRTDDAHAVGDLNATYGYDEVQRAPGRVARGVTPSPALAQSAQPYAGLSSELVHITGPAVACFGFVSPLPTEASVWTQVFRIFRNAEARVQAATWRPESTKILIQRIPSGGAQPYSIVWKN